MNLRPYQEKAVLNVAKKLASGTRKVCFQLATGGGKTVVFSAISERYIAKSDKDILILVHRRELLQQTRRTLFKEFAISAQVIVAGMKHIPKARVYVGMIESVSRRIQKISNIGMVIIDECHIASFNKIMEHFPEQYIIGFTATPLSNNKKKPLKNYYNDIVCGVDIPELIENKNLCQNITYAPRDVVDRARLTIKNGEFDDSVMSQQYSAPKYINSTVSAYERWAAGTKTIIFNVSIDHSRQVNDAFLLKGYNAKHLDSTMTDTERKNILSWFEHTPDAILNNVAILTAGFDVPSIETVIFNKATLSMPLWLQCTGRGSRPTSLKSLFTIIDMGANAITHGDWCDSRDWKKIFHNPPKARDQEKAPPIKYCLGCDAIIAAQCKTCPHCGYVFPEKEKELEEELSDFIIVTKNIDVKKLMEDNKEKKEYFPFFKIGNDLAMQAKKTIPKMTDENANFILEKYHALAKQWCSEVHKRYNQWHKDRAREHLFAELAKLYKNWQNPAPVVNLTEPRILQMQGMKTTLSI